MYYIYKVLTIKKIDMDATIEILVTEITLQNERIAGLEYTLRMLKSQLLDTHAEDSVIITIIDNALKK